MKTKMTIRLLAGAVLMLTATAALADTAGPAPKPKSRGPANFSGFFSPFPFQGGEAIYKGVCQGCHMPNAGGAKGAGASRGFDRGVIRTWRRWCCSVPNRAAR